MSAIPDYYGMNTDSFRDCITLDIEIPATIYIEGINFLPKDLKEEREILIKSLGDAVKWYKKIDMKLKIVYID